MLSNACPRCGLGFQDKQGLDEHLRLPPAQMCSMMRQDKKFDPEDGVTSSVIRQLTERKWDKKLDSWGSIYRVLFPEDEAIPPSRELRLAPTTLR